MPNAFYELGPNETVWADDCRVCPYYMTFDEKNNCDRQSVVDGHCYRGDWSEDNGWFDYGFELPPEWGTAVDYTYTFKYWSLGTWQNDEESQEVAASFYSSIHYSHNDDFSLTRSSQTQCAEWQTWQPSDGALDPYSKWQAADGGVGLNLTCFVSRRFPHTDWQHSTFWVGFGAADHVSNAYGLNGPRTTEAWVVSDFQIKFWPQNVITNSYYNLGAAEFKWADPCSECLPSIEFQASNSRMTCETLVSSDGRCFRGAFGRDNDFLTYLFQLPLAWDFPVDFRFTAIFWALGSWDSWTNTQIETAVVEHCDEANACTRHLEKERDLSSNCDGWLQWAKPSDNSSFTPLQWPASSWEGDETACYWPLDVSVSGWTADKLKILFGVFDTEKNEWGLSAEVNREAWVVSDFQIEFWPQNTRSTTPVPTTTTSKTSTTATVKPTTTSLSSTTTAAFSSTTPKARTTSTLLMESTTTKAPTKTTEGIGDNSGAKRDMLLIAFIAVVCVLICVLTLPCAVFCVYYLWFKAEDSHESSDGTAHIEGIQIERVVSGSVEPGAGIEAMAAKEPAADSGVFGQMLADIIVGNALMQEDIVQEADGVVTVEGEINEQWEADFGAQQFETAGFRGEGEH